MIYAKCPDCKRTRLLVSRHQGNDVLITYRLHHEPFPNVDFHLRHKNPVCKGSGRPLALGSPLSKL